MLHDHEDEVKQPNDAPAQEQTENSRNDFALFESCDSATDPGSEGDDREDKAHDPTKTKVIFVFCHFSPPYRLYAVIFFPMI